MLDGFGNPAIPVGMIFSMFRPSDDACTYPLFVPANLFAVVSLRQLATLASQVLKDTKLAEEAHALAAEVERAVNQYGKTQHAKYGEIWAYEVDGYGNTLMMDDANARIKPHGAGHLIDVPAQAFAQIGQDIGIRNFHSQK